MYYDGSSSSFRRSVLTLQLCDPLGRLDPSVEAQMTRPSSSDYQREFARYRVQRECQRHGGHVLHKSEQFIDGKPHSCVYGTAVDVAVIDWRPTIEQKQPCWRPLPPSPAISSSRRRGRGRGGRRSCGGGSPGGSAGGSPGSGPPGSGGSVSG